MAFNIDIAVAYPETNLTFTGVAQTNSPEELICNNSSIISHISISHALPQQNIFFQQHPLCLQKFSCLCLVIPQMKLFTLEKELQNSEPNIFVTFLYIYNYGSHRKRPNEQKRKPTTSRLQARLFVRTGMSITSAVQQ